MADYALPTTSKAHRQVESAVTHAIEQVNRNSTLDDAEKLEYAYLLVREKLDRMESSGEFDEMDVGVADTQVCEAVMNELATRLGMEIAQVSLTKSYPEDLPSIGMHGLALAQ